MSHPALEARTSRKQFFTLALIAGALMVTSPGQASMVASKSQCVASCGSAISTSCGWITKPGRFNRCRMRLLRQCRKFGTDVMCPAPPPPPAPPVTAPTAPVVTTTTTTTLPYVPPTTTTLPAPPPPVYGPWTGTWTFYGTILQNNCPSASYGMVETFYVTQSGTLFTAVPSDISGVALYGSMDSDGGFTVEGSWTLNGGPCVFDVSLSASPDASAGLAQITYCPAFSCTTVWSGTVS
jgi:hypothetical protein